MAQEILNELSAAKPCLLNATQRAKYDQYLRQAIHRHREDLAKAQQIGGVSLTLGQFLHQLQLVDRGVDCPLQPASAGLLVMS